MTSNNLDVFFKCSGAFLNDIQELLEEGSGCMKSQILLFCVKAFLTSEDPFTPQKFQVCSIFFSNAVKKPFLCQQLPYLF